jgi:hypothetical protein
LQFEYAWRRVHRRQRPRPFYDVDGRLESLRILMGKERWSRNAPRAKDVTLSIAFAETYEANRSLTSN